MDTGLRSLAGVGVEHLDSDRAVKKQKLIMYIKAENMYTGQKCGNHLVYFPSLLLSLTGYTV